MKKSFLKSTVHTAISIALGSALLSGSVLSTQAYAADLTAANNTSNDTATETYLYSGLGVGAASGALIAGPVGLVVGGLIGAITGASRAVVSDTETNSLLAESTAKTLLAADSIKNTDKQDMATSITSEQTTPSNSLQVAQIGEIKMTVETPARSQQQMLLDILTTDLSLDVYFRSGSSNIEAFYPARLTAIAELMNNMDQLELHLDGYSDRRGDKTKNIALANQRIEKVRGQLIDAGVDENRIISKAFGEMKMVSSAGDLEAYTFDRKVVIRFQRITTDSISSMTTRLSEFKAEPETENTNTVLANTGIEF